MKAVLMLIVLVVASLVMVTFVMARRAKRGASIAKRIKIDELESVLMNLRNGETDFDFIGIVSNGIDCLYFMIENDRFNLDFEAMENDQVPYIDRLKQFCTVNNINCKVMTYNNKPHYPSEEPAPVIRMECNAPMDAIIDIAKRIQREVFSNNNETVYDIVP